MPYALILFVTAGFMLWSVHSVQEDKRRFVAACMERANGHEGVDDPVSMASKCVAAWEATVRPNATH